MPLRQNRSDYAAARQRLRNLISDRAEIAVWWRDESGVRFALAATRWYNGIARIEDQPSDILPDTGTRVGVIYMIWAGNRKVAKYTTGGTVAFDAAQPPFGGAIADMTHDDVARGRWRPASC